MRSRFRFSAGVVVVASAMAAVAATPASAQGYPTKPIELVVPFVAGGTTDNIARLMAQRFTESWSQTVIVNNRPGAGSTIGTSAVAKSAPDGHTLLVTTFAFAAAPALQKVSFDPIKDFAPITELASLPMMLVVHPSLPVKNLQEFIALAKSSAGGLDYASSGPGTSTHLAAEMFNTMANVRLVHVPYKGNAEVFNALLGGHIKVHFSLVPSAIAHVRAGKLRVLAVTSEKRLPYLPDVPTVAESGFPGLRDQLVARRAGAGRNAAGRRRQDQQRARSSCSRRRRCANAWRAKAPIRSAARRSSSRSASRARSTNGRRWRKPPA